MKQRKFSAAKLLIMSSILLLTSLTSISALASSSSDIVEKPEYVQKVFNKDKVTEINIDINQADWNWLCENATKKEYRSCTVTINDKTFNNVGVKPKGNSSLVFVDASDSDRFSFKLDFGQFIEGQTCYGLRKISLNNMFSDKTYMKEYLSYDMFDYMGVASPEFAFTHIKINGKEWGLYLAIESIDETFMERRFGTKQGNMYKPETMAMGGANGGMPNFAAMGKNQDKSPASGAKDTEQKEMPAGDKSKDNMMPPLGGFGGGAGTDLKYKGDSPSNYSGIKDNIITKATTDNDFNKVIKMIKNLNDGTNLEKYLDVDEILRYFAVNTFLVNLDSYSGGMYHNYYLYEKDGNFKVLPWDLNVSFAGMSMSDGSKAINFPIDKPVTTSLEDAPLIGKLLEVPEYKERYHKYLNQIADEYIYSGKYEASIAKIYRLINGYVKNDATPFYTYEEFEKSIPVLTTFGKDRAKSIIAQLKGEQPSAEYGQLATTVDLSMLGGMQIGDFNGKMPDMSEIQEIKSIINEANGKELTSEQKNKLKEFGINEDMIPMVKNMAKMFDSSGKINLLSIAPIRQIIAIIISIVFLLLGLLFVFKFKRKSLRTV